MCYWSSMNTIRLDIAQFSLGIFMEWDKVEVHINAGKEQGYYPAILTEQDWSIKDLVYSEIFWFIYCPRVPYGTGCHYVPNIYSFFLKFSQPNKNQEWLDYFKSWWRKPAVFVFFVLTFFCYFFATLLPTLSKYFELCKCAPCNFFSYVELK